jgi:predicted DCC family thiol-disulfide oxidoreductase YuxK
VNDVPTGGPVVVFDGVCNLCNRLVTALLRIDRRKVLRFASLQGTFGQQVLAAHSLGDVDSIVFVDGDKVRVESDAVLAIVSALGMPWKVFVVGWVIPRPVRDALYRWIARHRIGWFGERDSCMMPTPGLRSRFVD